MNNLKSGIFNCGTGEINSFQDMADIIMNFYPGNKIKYIKFPKELENKYQVYTKSNIKNFRNTVCNIPFTSLDEGIKKYFNYLKNK